MQLKQQHTEKEPPAAPDKIQETVTYAVKAQCTSPHSRRTAVSRGLLDVRGFREVARTSMPLSRRSSSALRAEQLTVWKASSAAAGRRGEVLEKRSSSSVSIVMVLMSIGYPAYLYGPSSVANKEEEE